MTRSTPKDIKEVITDNLEGAIQAMDHICGTQATVLLLHEALAELMPLLASPNVTHVPPNIAQWNNKTTIVQENRTIKRGAFLTAPNFPQPLMILRVVREGKLYKFYCDNHASPIHSAGITVEYSEKPIVVTALDEFKEIPAPALLHLKFECPDLFAVHTDIADRKSKGFPPLEVMGKPVINMVYVNETLPTCWDLGTAEWDRNQIPVERIYEKDGKYHLQLKGYDAEIVTPGLSMEIVGSFGNSFARLVVRSLDTFDVHSPRYVIELLQNHPVVGKVHLAVMKANNISLQDLDATWRAQLGKPSISKTTPVFYHGLGINIRVKRTDTTDSDFIRLWFVKGHSYGVDFVDVKPGDYAVRVGDRETHVYKLDDELLGAFSPMTKADIEYFRLRHPNHLGLLTEHQ